MSDFKLPGGLVHFHRMKASTSPVQIKTPGGGGKDVEIKSFPGTRPQLAQVALSASKRGQFATGLTQEEQDFLEPLLGLEKGQLSPIVPDLANPEKVRNCYYLQPRAMMELPVHKALILNLAIPSEYLRYKLLSQLSTVAVGMAAYNENPQAEYVMIREDEEVEQKHSTFSKKKEAYTFIADWTSTQYSDYLWTQGIDPRHLKPYALETQVGQVIEKNPSYFLKQVSDKTYKEKVQIGEMVRLGVLEVRGNSYKFQEASLADSLPEMVDFLQDKQKQNVKVEILKELKARKG